MKINLFTNWYKSYRDEENEACLRVNINNPRINKIYLFCDDGKEVPEHEKIIAVNLAERATYEHFFHVANDGNQDFSIIANSDIYFDETLDYLKFMKDNDCYALTRWDVRPERTFFYNHIDSQDVWLFKGKIKENIFSDFQLGKLGCDNRIAYEIKKAGYNLTNPSLSIKAYHLHLEERELNGNHDKKETISPPYEYVTPSKIIPFMSIITRHLYSRPNMLKSCCDSVNMQKDKDFEHVVLWDNKGIGSTVANGMFFENKDKVTGKYVFMLDDDDVFTTDDFINDMKMIVDKYNNPGIIFVRMLINDELYPTSVNWGREKLYQNHIGTSNVVVRNDLWHKYIHLFLKIQTGDFHFISSLVNVRPSIVWQDKIYSKTTRVSRGASE